MDMTPTIVPKSDQINADDLLSGPITIRITDVKIKPGEQPVSIFFEGSEKAYRCCKSMARVLVSAWGPDASKYKGRSLTLYCDPRVKWGGMEVGGIRISHMSDIDGPLTMALTVTRANKKPFTVKPIQKSAPQANPLPSGSPQATTGEHTGEPVGADAGCEVISPDEALVLEARCSENGINIAALKKAAGIERISMIKPADLARAHGWIDKAIAARKEKS